MRGPLVVGFVLLCGSRALASPAWPFEELLRRAEHVLTARVKVDGNHVAVVPTAWLRGGVRGPLHLVLAADSRPPPAECLVISQGDAYWGEPTDDIRLGQGIEAQASYRGWIAFPLVKGVAEAGRRMTLANVRSLVARFRYRRHPS